MLANKISVIIPTYNEESNIARLLTQLTAMPQLEIVVSDGGSTDATCQIVSQFPVQLVSGELGRGRQLNAGVRRTSRDILVFIHADSEVGPEIFSEISEAVERGRPWGCCTLIFDSQRLFFRYLAWVSGLRARYGSICFGDQGIFCSRDLFYQAGGFRNFPIMEDFELSRRLKEYARAYVIAGKIKTSSRRFVKGGLLRTLGKIQIIKLLFLAGVAPERLAAIYKTNLREGLWKRLLY